MKQFVIRQWFLFALITVLAIGASAPDQFAWFVKLTLLHKLVVAAVMVLTTLPVNFQTIRNTVARPAPALVAAAIAFLFIPLLAWPIASQFPADLAIGIMVAATTPTTLATGAVWTRRAEGNDVIPIMVTVITNMTCFAVAPFWLWLTMGSSAELSLPLADTALKLFLLVVVPMIVGQLLRRVGGMAKWSTDHRQLLSTMCLTGILSIVLVGAVQCGARFKTEGISPWDRKADFALMLLAVATIHIVALGLGWNVSQRLKFDRADSIGVAFAGSQKTLMVGLQLALMVGGGLAILPLFTYHFFQLVFDTAVADFWRENGRSHPAVAGND